MTTPNPSTEQQDPWVQWCRAMTQVLPGDPPCRYEHAEWKLCDDDGQVRGGAMHHGTDYTCTAHAHYAGLHIRCTSPAHEAPIEALSPDDWTCS